MSGFLTASEQRAKSQDDILLFDEITAIEKAVLEAGNTMQYETTVSDSPMTDTDFIPSTLATLESTMKVTNTTIMNRGYDYIVGDEYSFRGGVSFALTYELNSTGIIVGGKGYKVGDIINLDGGFPVADDVVVLEVSAINETTGAVISLLVVSGGEYTTIAQDPLYTKTNSAGTGLMITTSWNTKSEDIAKVIVTEIDADGGILDYNVIDSGNYTTLPTDPVELNGAIIGDITSAVYDTRVASDLPTGVTSSDGNFNLDGTRLLRLTQDTSKAYQTLIDYKVDVAYDIESINTNVLENTNRTMSFVKETIEGDIMSTDLTCYSYEDGGKYMFVLDRDDNKMYKIVLPEPYCSHIYNNHISSDEIRVDTQYPQTVGTHLNLDSETSISSHTLPTLGHYFKFSPDGLKLFVMERNTGVICQYGLDSKYNLSVMTLEGAVTLQSGTQMNSFQFRDSGMKLVTCGVNDYKLYSFQLDAEYNIINMTPTTTVILTIDTAVLMTPITSFCVMDTRNKLWVGGDAYGASYDMTLTGPHGATFDLDWGIKDILVMDGGLGYQLPPLVVIGQSEDQGNPSALSTIKDTSVDAIEVISGGYGYDEKPSISLIVQGLASEYYYVWTGMLDDNVSTDQMNKVIKYFRDKGYSILRVSNPDTANTFVWKINW